MGATMTAPLVLERQGDGWRLRLSGRLVVGGAAEHRSAASRFARAGRHFGVRLDAGAGAGNQSGMGTAAGGWPTPAVNSHWMFAMPAIRRISWSCCKSCMSTGMRHTAWSHPPPTLERLVGKVGRWGRAAGLAWAWRDRLPRPHFEGHRRGLLPAARAAGLISCPAYL